MQTSRAKYNFSERVVLITGAAAGIGRAIAGKFYEDGAVVIIADIQEKNAERLAESLGSRALSFSCDISDSEQVDQLFANVADRFGRLDILINNAGINSTAATERVSTDLYPDTLWKRIIGVDLNGTFYCCRAGAKIMRGQRSGVIINIASVAAIVALRLQVGFVAAKAAVSKMTEAMACELGPAGIRVNAVSPGSIVTDATRQLFYSETGTASQMAERLISFIPQGRPGEPPEIAEAVAFLASDSASYINGHNLIVDGGWTCGFNRDF
jgi:3-oxoacyl-[acyl-carrier protein] reductase